MVIEPPQTAVRRPFRTSPDTAPDQLAALTATTGRTTVRPLRSSRIQRWRCVVSFGHVQMIELLDRELDAVSGVLDEVTDEEWETSTHLVPEGQGTPPWRVSDLVAHIDISIGLTLGLLDTIQDG